MNHSDHDNNKPETNKVSRERYIIPEDPNDFDEEKGLEELFALMEDLAQIKAKYL